MGTSAAGAAEPGGGVVSDRHGEDYEPLDALVERIRVASFEAPKAGSHTEWARRIKGMFEQVGYWHDDPGRCNHPANDPGCVNGNGVWSPVYRLKLDPTHSDQGSPS